MTTNNIPFSQPTVARVSIIIVTYNAAAHLQKCLDSIYAQRYPAIDIIVIDGASTDGTVEIIQSNAQRLAYWVSEKDEGIYDAMNKGLDHVTGDWIYFLGSDDVLLPEFSDMITRLDDADTIYYGNVMFGDLKRWGPLKPYYMAKYGIYHQSIFYPKSVFENYKYNTHYKITADNVLNMQLYKDKRYRYAHLDFLICDYSPFGISGTQVDTVFEKERLRLIYANFGIAVWFRYWFKRMKAKVRGNK